MVFVWVHVYMHVKAYRGQKRIWESPHPVTRNPFTVPYAARTPDRETILLLLQK